MSNAFVTAADAARTRGKYDLARSLAAEGRIVHKLVHHALASGYTVSVYDGEEWPLKHSASMHDIMHAVGSTDEDVLLFRTAEGLKVGCVMLVYGNGSEVISDYSSSDLEAFSLWLKPVEGYAERA